MPYAEIPPRKLEGVQPRLFAECATRQYWQTHIPSNTDPSKPPYLVEVRRWTATNNLPEREVWTCSCVGYGYRLKCSHITKAKALYCGWSEIIDGGTPPKDDNDHYTCPDCGGPIVYKQFET